MKNLSNYVVKIYHQDNPSEFSTNLKLSDLKEWILEGDEPDPIVVPPVIVPGKHVPAGYLPVFSENFHSPVYIMDGDDRSAFGAWIDSWYRWRVKKLDGNNDKVIKSYIPGFTHVVTPENKLNLSAGYVDDNLVGGMISTERTFPMRYGYWETELSNLSVPKGYHLSVWLLRDDGEYGNVSPREIDLVEIVNGGTEGTQGHLWFNNHPSEGQSITRLAHDWDSTMTLGFLSTPGLCRWYLNGAVVREARIDLQEPMYFLITWEGDSNWPGNIEDKAAIASVDVSYVSAFKPEPTGEKIEVL